MDPMSGIGAIGKMMEMMKGMQSLGQQAGGQQGAEGAEGGQGAEKGGNDPLKMLERMLGGGDKAGAKDMASMMPESDNGRKVEV